MKQFRNSLEKRVWPDLISTSPHGSAGPMNTAYVARLRPSDSVHVGPPTHRISCCFFIAPVFSPSLDSLESLLGILLFSRVLVNSSYPDMAKLPFATCLSGGVGYVGSGAAGRCVGTHLARSSPKMID